MQPKPSRVAVELGLDSRKSQRDEGAPAALGLHAAPEALDDGDGLVVADGAPAGFDAKPPAPSSIIRLELDATVGDEMLRRSTRLIDGSLEEATDVAAAKKLLEGLELDGSSGVLISAAPRIAMELAADSFNLGDGQDKSPLR